MNCRFTYELTPEEQKEWESFFNSLSIATIEQLPSWTSVSIKHGKYCYFIGRKNENLVCCSIIAERKSGFIRYADIQFGPLFISPDDLIESINEIVRHYQSLNFAYLSLQLAIPSGSDSDYIEHNINKKLRPLTYFNRDNWSSIALSLEASDQAIAHLRKACRERPQVAGVRFAVGGRSGDAFQAGQDLAVQTTPVPLRSRLEPCVKTRWKVLESHVWHMSP